MKTKPMFRLSQYLRTKAIKNANRATSREAKRQAKLNGKPKVSEHDCSEHDHIEEQTLALPPHKDLVTE
jgi:branched-subunit amino acid aminotransferase/4-amino-4-deoxychorismate lyase